MAWKCFAVAILVTFTLGISAACRGPVTPTPPGVYSLPQLEYRLFSRFDNVFWCDPDFYPVARPGQEEKNALEQFPIIRVNETEFSAILEHLGMPNKAEYTDQEKLQIYREHKKLAFAVQMTALGDAYNFILRVGEGQGNRIEGTIIDTPEGPVPVEKLRNGMAVWTFDDSRGRVAAVVVDTAVTAVPSSFQVVRIRLDDGRTVTGSAGHPTAEGRALGDYQVGDILDGGLVIAAKLVAYQGNATYDLLPSGTTGVYSANGVLLRSTLTPH